MEQGQSAGDVRSLIDTLALTEFWAACAIGMLIIFEDSRRRYQAPVFILSRNRRIATLSPRYLTSNYQFLKSFTAYFLLRVLAFLLPVFFLMFTLSSDVMRQFIIGDPEAGAEAADNPIIGWLIPLPDMLKGVVTTANFPLFWAAISVGLLAQLPFIGKTEAFLRRVSQVFGAIPLGVERLTERLSAAEIDRKTAFPYGLPATSFFRAVDIGDFEPDASYEKRRWARIATLLHQLVSQLEAARFDRDFEDIYRAELDRNVQTFRNLSARIALSQVRDAGLAADDPALRFAPLQADETLDGDLEDFVFRLEFFLATLARNVAGNVQAAATRLEAAGFQLPKPRRRPGRGGTYIALLASIFGAVIVGGVFAEIGRSFMAVIPNVEPPTEIFILNPERGLLDPIGRVSMVVVPAMLIVFGVIFGSFAIGSRTFGIQLEEPDNEPLFERPITRYLLASIIGGVVGVLVLVFLNGLGDLDPERAARGAKFGIYDQQQYFFVFVTLGFMLHLVIHSEIRSIGDVVLRALVVTSVYTLSNFLFGLVMFKEIAVGATLDQAIPDKISQAETLGTAAYFSIMSFFVGFIVCAVFIYLHGTQRDGRFRREQKLAEQAESSRRRRVGDDDEGLLQIGSERDAMLH